MRRKCQCIRRSSLYREEFQNPFLHASKFMKLSPSLNHFRFVISWQAFIRLHHRNYFLNIYGLLLIKKGDLPK